MKKSLILILVLSLFSSKMEACANAHIFKVFPLGMCNDTIVTVDFHIYRGMNDRLVNFIDDKAVFAPQPTWSMKVSDSKPMDFSYTLYSYLCKYDKNQQLLEKIAVDSVEFSKDDYLDMLQEMYTRSFDKAKNDNQNLRLFTPKSIVFGNFDNTCKNVKVQNDEVIYKGTKYTMPILKDSTYYGFNIDYYSPDMLAPIGSVRHYTLDNKELTVIHFQMGQQFDGVKITKPKVKFNDLATAVYEEPIIYHGNGYDLFIVNEKKKKE